MEARKETNLNLDKMNEAPREMNTMKEAPFEQRWRIPTHPTPRVIPIPQPTGTALDAVLELDHALRLQALT